MGFMDAYMGLCHPMDLKLDMCIGKEGKAHQPPKLKFLRMWIETRARHVGHKQLGHLPS